MFSGGIEKDQWYEMGYEELIGLSFLRFYSKKWKFTNCKHSTV